MLKLLTVLTLVAALAATALASTAAAKGGDRAVLTARARPEARS